MTPDMENPLHSLPHYVTGEYAHNKTFLEDNEYARALDCFVKGVVDVFLTDPRGKILLGHRLVHPQPDWWVLGGRMRAGDTPAETARRNAIRETRLDIAPERWEFVCAHTLLWQFRKQAPSGNGTADFGVIMHAVVTDEEVARMTMCNEEYDGYGWYTSEEILADESKHPVVRRGVRELIRKGMKERIHAAVVSGADDATIAAAVRQLYAPLGGDVDTPIATGEAAGGGEA